MSATAPEQRADQADRRTDQTVLLVTEILLVLLTLAAVASFARLFVGSAWVNPLIAATIVAHLTVAVVRRANRGLLLSGVAAMIVMSLQITWTHYRETTTAGLPTRATRDALDVDISAAWNLFSNVKAPTESTIGFLVMATVGIWVIAYLADWAAFRLWSALETVLPSFGLFVFISFFGTDESKFGYAALYLGALITFQLFHRLMRQSHEVRWLAGTQRSGISALARAGSVVALVAVLGAAAAGPALPGAEHSALIDLEQGSGTRGDRIVVSPIVDIRGRLVDQADVEAFTVRTDSPSYWRLASLDQFDGQIWGAKSSYSRVSTDLPEAFPASLTADASLATTTQEFTIVDLGAVWVPAAYEPRKLTNKSTNEISYEAVSGTLIVQRSLESSDGLTYTVESAIPSFDPSVLAGAGRLIPEEIRDRYTGLPADFSPRAQALAFEIVESAGATNDYEKSLALQEFFREFDYSLEVGPGHSSARVDAFLDAQVGYCEQFAGTFAAMARSLGIPSRVAVGFTWGEEDPNDPGLYHVRGEHAHAWPEVYIPGSGWVAFEPTPGRGAPNSAQWTNVVPDQVGIGDATLNLPTPPPLEQPTGPTLPDTPADETAAAAEAEAVGAAPSSVIPGWYATVGLVLLGAIAAFALYALTISAAKRIRQNRRFDAAGDNRGRVQAVWSDAVEQLSPLGLDQEAAETVREFADRAGKQAPVAAPVLVKLGGLTVQASYGPSEPADSDVQVARGQRDEVRSTVQQLTTPTQRWRTLLDPRTLFKT